MSNTSDFRNGLIIDHKNNLFKIVEFQHVKPGKGGAFVRTKLKNIKTGQMIDETFRSGANISIIRIEAREYNYLYSDGSTFFFMDNETYEQIELQESLIYISNERYIYNNNLDMYTDALNYYSQFLSDYSKDDLVASVNYEIEQINNILENIKE